jgi:hypothetical protein
MGVSRIQARLTARGTLRVAVTFCQPGSLKRAHHFGLNLSATFGEQLILQDSVTQSMSSPLASPPSVLGAAALAAGDKLLLLAADGDATGGTA